MAIASSSAATDGPPPLTGFLREVELFSTVRPEWLERLESAVEEVRLGANEMLFRAGDAADSVYVVRDGQIAMFTDTPGKPVRLVARVGPADVLGIVDSLGGSRRVTSARAVCESSLLRLAREDLLRLLGADSALGLRFTLAVVSRHARNAAAALELGNRREMRIRVNREVELLIGHHRRIRARVANLSRGGICLSEVAPDSLPPAPTWYAIYALDGDLILRFNGRVVWRQGDRTGIAFDQRPPAHELLVQGALRRLLRAPEPLLPGAGTTGRSSEPSPAR